MTVHQPTRQLNLFKDRRQRDERLPPALITHLRRQRPTWLLLDGDWPYTRQALPFLAYCSHIVTVGRLRWIPGSPHTGMDSCAWLRFQAEETETRFFGREAATAGLPLFTEPFHTLERTT